MVGWRSLGSKQTTRQRVCGLELRMDIVVWWSVDAIVQATLLSRLFVPQCSTTILGLSRDPVAALQRTFSTLLPQLMACMGWKCLRRRRGTGPS